MKYTIKKVVGSVMDWLMPCRVELRQLRIERDSYQVANQKLDDMVQSLGRSSLALIQERDRMEREVEFLKGRIEAGRAKRDSLRAWHKSVLNKWVESYKSCAAQRDQSRKIADERQNVVNTLTLQVESLRCQLQESKDRNRCQSEALQDADAKLDALAKELNESNLDQTLLRAFVDVVALVLTKKQRAALVEKAREAGLSVDFCDEEQPLRAAA